MGFLKIPKKNHLTPRKFRLSHHDFWIQSEVFIDSIIGFSMVCWLNPSFFLGDSPRLLQVSSCFTKELEASRRNSLVTFKVGEHQHHGAAGHRRRQRLSSALVRSVLKQHMGVFWNGGTPIAESFIMENHGKSMNILQTSMIWGSPILGHFLMDLI